MLELLVGAAIFAGGVVVGRFLPERRGRAGRRKEIQPICSCGHAVSFHNDQGCHAQATISKWDNGRWMGAEQEPCTCQKYTGPEPLPTFYAPEITE